MDPDGNGRPADHVTDLPVAIWIGVEVLLATAIGIRVGLRPDRILPGPVVEVNGLVVATVPSDQSQRLAYPVPKVVHLRLASSSLPPAVSSDRGLCSGPTKARPKTAFLKLGAQSRPPDNERWVVQIRATEFETRSASGAVRRKRFTRPQPVPPTRRTATTRSPGAGSVPGFGEWGLESRNLYVW